MHLFKEVKMELHNGNQVCYVFEELLQFLIHSIQCSYGPKQYNELLSWS